MVASQPEHREGVGEVAPPRRLLLSTPALRILGGTEEIMKNILAERVLGLPKEPGIDTKTPFREMRR